MKDWSSIIGHTDAISYLQHVLANNAVPQCMIFLGPEHVGKRTVADIFVGEMKERFPGSEIHHIDAWNIEKNDYAVIRIDEIRAIAAGSLYTQQPNVWNIIVIDGADYLNEEASNSLLKVMEEPSDRVLFLLIAHRIQRILPTIRSRASLVRFRLVPSVLRNVSGLPGLASPENSGRIPFDARLFTAPIHEQLLVAASLTSHDFLSIEMALQQMAHSSDPITQRACITSSNRYVRVHEMNRIGTLSNAFEHLFF
ncbi:MAG: AAA family ATPase [Patescibacteria group bacterium]